jgi:hypothetical protein
LARALAAREAAAAAAVVGGLLAARLVSPLGNLLQLPSARLASAQRPHHSSARLAAALILMARALARLLSARRAAK